MTISHNALLRFDRTEEDIRQWQFGGNSQAIHFNTLVPTTARDFTLNSVLDSFKPGFSKSTCNELMSILSRFSENQVNFAYNEYSGTCDERDWGYQLIAGYETKALNEVLVTADTGYGLGDEISGLTPEPLRVVGIVANPNSDNARVIIAHSGTFRASGWPETAKNWPNLNAIAVSTFSGQEQTALENYFRNLDQNVAFDYLNYPRTPLLDKVPYVYSWTAFPLFLAAILFSFALRNNYTKRRMTLLNTQGGSGLQSGFIILIANGIQIFLAGTLAVMIGSLFALAFSEPIRLMSSRRLGPFPLPLDPLFKFFEALMLVLIGIGLSIVLAKVFIKLSKSAEKIHLGPRLAATLSILFLAAAWASLAAPLFQLSYFAFVLLLTVSLAFIGDRLVSLSAKRARAKDFASELARRRVLGNGFRSGLAMIGAVLAIAPVLTFLLMFSSALAESNRAAVSLPDENSVCYEIYQPSARDSQIESLALKYAGTDGKANYFYYLKTLDDVPVVASSTHMGAVIVADSAGTLEQMLQQKLKKQSITALENDGILWFGDSGYPTIWTLNIDTKPAEEIAFSRFAFQEVSTAWSNQAKAVILAKSLAKHNLLKDHKTLIVTGISRDESLKLSEALLAAGLDPSLVRYHKVGDAYTEAPLQLGITALMGLLAIGIISSSTRSMISSLKLQSKELLSIGVPNKWIAQVFFREFSSTIGIGIVIGLALTSLASSLALVRFNLSLSAPWFYIGIYSLLILSFVSYVVWSGFRRLRV